MSTSLEGQGFGRWRARLWPVHGYELKKLIPMILLFFFILFNYTILRDTKDTLVVTAAKGSQIIPFLKFWGVMPGALIVMFIYSELSNKLSKPALFYSSIAPFIVFFGLFGWVLYPYRGALSPTDFCAWLSRILPAGFRGLIDVIELWPFSLYYVFSELWGSVGISLVYWGFANDNTSVSESKRFYPIFTLFANISLIFSGKFIQWASVVRTHISSSDPWQTSLHYMMSTVIVSGILILGVYWWINRYVLTDERFYNPVTQARAKKEKPKLSMKESFLFLIRSKYLGCIAILVMGYGISINLVEVTWKHLLHLQYPSYNDYSAFMGKFSETTGIITIVVTFFLSGSAIRKMGWKRTAVITPVILLVTGVFFFSFTIFRGELVVVIARLGTHPLFLAVIFGAIQNIASKAAKYAFFDPTKEMAYIPLDQELKIKGKAAVDVVAARLGKSGGSLIQQGLLIALVSVSAIIPYVAGILFFIIFVWIWAVCALSRQFSRLTKKRKEEEEEEERRSRRGLDDGCLSTSADPQGGSSSS